MFPAAVALVLAANTLIAYILARGEFALALPVGVLPIALIAFGALVARNRAVLLIAALALPMIDVIREAPLFSGGLQIYPADVLLILAVGSWIGQRLLAHDEETRRALRLRSSLLVWPTILFGSLVLVALLRGHAAYGESYLGNPARLLLYAAAGTTLAGLTARQVYRAIVLVFYSGTVWVLLSVAFHFSSGTSQTRADTLSTGGTRFVALSVSLYVAAALFLALLNLELDQRMGMRALHLSMVGLSTFGILLAFGRGTFAAVAAVVPLLVLGFRRVRSAVFAVVPLLIPFIVLVALVVPHVFPDLGPTLADRVSLSAVEDPSTDQSLNGRLLASEQIWREVRDEPMIGSGFGRTATVVIVGIPRTISQNYHNSWLYLLAAGGALLLSSFLLVCAAFVVEVIRRLRQPLEAHERILVLWSAFTLFAFLINALAEPLFGWPSVLLTVWILLFIPSVVPLREQTETESARLTRTRLVRATAR
jgi:O-antigen ligase